MKSLRIFCVAVALAAPPLTGHAHGGEDHGDAAAPAPVASAAPRAQAQSEDFELVAEVQGQALVLFLDRFDSNAPVVGAQVEVDSGGPPAMAAETAPGVYRVAASPWTQPGRHALTVSVQAGDTADLLSATLDVPAAAAAAPAAPLAVGSPATISKRSLWALAGALALAALGGFTWLRRRASTPS
ncbi:MAG: hypothetical protein KBF40_00275 [Giesbergeria sp.]|nr:hypothetical protein [Giesbergeria sp.]MBP9783163.1 hypothetical protein [Giesbergeria sp.]MBP9893758.1 hypothetical protein [Giesbergeria sp.]